MKEIRFISYLFLINLVIIDIKCISNQNNSYNIYNNFNDYSYSHTHCLIHLSINNYNNIFGNFEFCRKCDKKNEEQQSKIKNCEKCMNWEILTELTIISPEETLNEILNNNKSISRYGDGEFDLLFGSSIGFQKVDKILSKRLSDILQSNDEGLLIGIPDILNMNNLYKFMDGCQKFWTNWHKKRVFKLVLALNENKTYYSSFMTRFYILYRDQSKVPKYIEKLKQIWNKRDVVIIEGEKSRLGVNNDLFNNVKSIQRILCPFINAFNIYEKILKEALQIEKNKLILLALGPTATILAYDLYHAGYQVIDIGHADIEYEWFLRNATRAIKIPYKYVYEAKNGTRDIEKVIEKEYYNQIIKKILN